MWRGIPGLASDLMEKKDQSASRRSDPLRVERAGQERSRKGHQSLWWWPALGAAAVVAGELAQGIRLPGGWLIGPLMVAIVAGMACPEHPRLSSRWLIPAKP